MKKVKIYHTSGKSNANTDVIDYQNYVCNLKKHTFKFIFLKKFKFCFAFLYICFAKLFGTTLLYSLLFISDAAR